MRAHHVHIEHDFGKPPELIFAYLAEHENLAEVFGAKITRLRDGDGGERNGVGSVRQLKDRAGTTVRGDRHGVRRPRADRLSHHQGRSAARPRGDHDLHLRPGGGTRFVYDIRLASPIPGLALIVRSALTRSITRSLPVVESAA